MNNSLRTLHLVILSNQAILEATVELELLMSSAKKAVGTAL